MKIYIGPYRDRWISGIHERYMNRKYGYLKWDYSNTVYEHFLERLEKDLQWIYDHSINLILDRLPYQRTKIRIDKYDTWGMDDTLAPIILPMLKQLKAQKQGSPNVDSSDVPEHLRNNNPNGKEFWGDDQADEHFHARWDYVLDEMIWAFEEKCKDDWEKEYYGDWIEDENDPLGGHFGWYDAEGRKKHQERMSNGFCLFGKYFENLWS